MTTQTEVMPLFDGLRTVGEIDRRYKELFREMFPDPNDMSCSPRYWALVEARRKAHEGLSADRSNKREPVGPDHISGRLIRNWAMKEGIPLGKKGKVPIQIETAYRREHNLAVAEKPRKLTMDDTAATPTEIRAWARDHDVECGNRGRINPNVIAQYVAAKVA